MPSTRSSDNTDDWRSSPPYALADGRESGEYTKHTAACFCGAVRWGFSESKPLQAKYCQCVTPFIPAKAPIPADTRHRLALDSCSTCQQLHGAPFQWAAIFRKDHLLFEPNSLDHIGFYDSREKSSARKLPCKVSCKQCHSPLMDEGNNMVRLSPSAARPINHLTLLRRPAASVVHPLRQFDCGHRKGLRRCSACMRPHLHRSRARRQRACTNPHPA
jgi:hypothetical protein